MPEKDCKPASRRLLLLAVAAALMAVVLPLPLLRSALSSPPADPTEEEYPVRGIDISAHNGQEIDFEAVRRQGFRFVIIKASEGSSFKDRRFYTNIARARRAGLKVGAYHFFRFDATGYAQALNFLHSLRGQRLDLPVVIDIEQWTNPAERTQRVLSTLYTFIRHLEREGHRVMLYTNKDGWREYVEGRLVDFPLWIASMTEFDKPRDWTLWQYSHRGRVEGISGAVDLNVYNGTVEEWEQWCASNRTLMQ